MRVCQHEFKEIGIAGALQAIEHTPIFCIIEAVYLIACSISTNREPDCNRTNQIGNDRD